MDSGTRKHLDELVYLRDWLRSRTPSDDPGLLALDWALGVLLGPSLCEHGNVARVSPLYVDGRPLYRCEDCGARFTYEDDEPSFKALAPLKGTDAS